MIVGPLLFVLYVVLYVRVMLCKSKKGLCIVVRTCKVLGFVACRNGDLLVL